MLEVEPRRCFYSFSYLIKLSIIYCLVRFFPRYFGHCPRPRRMLKILYVREKVAQRKLCRYFILCTLTYGSCAYDVHLNCCHGFSDGRLRNKQDGKMVD